MIVDRPREERLLPNASRSDSIYLRECRAAFLERESDFFANGEPIVFPQRK